MVVLDNDDADMEPVVIAELGGAAPPLVVVPNLALPVAPADPLGGLNLPVAPVVPLVNLNLPLVQPPALLGGVNHLVSHSVLPRPTPHDSLTDLSTSFCSFLLHPGSVIHRLHVPAGGNVCHPLLPRPP